MSKLHLSSEERLLLYRFWRLQRSQEHISNKINAVLRSVPPSSNSLSLSLECDPLWPSWRHD